MRLDLRSGARYNDAYDGACAVVFDGITGCGPLSEAAQDMFEREFERAMTFLEHNHPQMLDVMTVVAVEQHPLRVMDE